MLFDLESVRLSDGVVEHWKFNSDNNDLYTPDGMLIKREKVKTSPCCDHKSRRIYDLSIQLGFACDQNCVYCLQAQRQEPKPEKHLSVDEFLKKLEIIEFEDDACIEFWGGEPLVYWKTLKELIPKLRARLPSVNMYMSSNCATLTREIVDFMHEHRVCILLSHDGKYNLLTRRYELSKTAYDAINYAIQLNKNLPEHLRVKYNSVITDYNADLNEHAEWMLKHFPDIMPLRQQPLTNTNANYLKNVKFTKYETYVNTSIERYYRHNETYPFKMYYRRMVEDMTKDFSGYDRFNCGIFSDRYLCLDLNGNMLYCHNDKQSYGHIDHYDEAKVQIGFDNNVAKCKDCPWKSFCFGGCPMYETLGETCSYYPRYFVTFYIFMRNAFNVSVRKVTPL